MNSDVLIIGGGVIGLSIARELHKKGVKRITLLEKGVAGRESSWAAAGMLGPQVEANEGGTFFDMMLESRDLYPPFADELLDETGVDIELDRAGTLYLGFTQEDTNELRERFEWQKKAGLPVEYLSAEDACKVEPFISTETSEALLFPNDWQVENRKLLDALRRYAEIKGIEIRENTRVERLVVDSGKVTGAETDNGTFLADKTVLATGAWTSLIKVGIVESPIKIEPVRGQIVAFQTTNRLFRRVIYSRRGYIVPRADGRILAGSTSENVGFDKSVTESAATRLREIAFEIAPSISSLPVADQWAGLRPFAADGLPILGEIAGLDGLFIATAHYRNGILLAPLTARIAAMRLVSGTDSKYLADFDPGRFSLRSAGRGS